MQNLQTPYGARGIDFTSALQEICFDPSQIRVSRRHTPIIQSTKVELVVNRKTAKAFGPDFPLSLLGRADEVIE